MRPALTTLLALGLCAGAAFAQDVPEEVSLSPEPERWFENSDVITHTTGEGIYAAVCAACHMPDGEGAEGAGFYPALAGNPNLEFPQYPIFVTVHGLRAMPPLGNLLDDEQVAAVVEYIQTSFGNEFDEPVSADMVDEVR